MQPDELVFTTNPNEFTAKNNEEKAWIRMIEDIGLTERYDYNGRYKKNFHSMRAFVSSQIYNHTNDAEYAHAYLGHDTYLNQYLRKSEEGRAKMFKNVEPALMIFSEKNQKREGESSSRIALLEKKLENLEKDLA